MSVGEAVSHLSQVLEAEEGIYKRWICCSSCLTFLLVVPDYCLSLEASRLLMREILIFFYYFCNNAMCILHVALVENNAVIANTSISTYLTASRKRTEPRKRKMMDEVCSTKKWTDGCLFFETNNVALCLICKEMVIVFKDYNWKNITCKNMLPNLMRIWEHFEKTKQWNHKEVCHFNKIFFIRLKLKWTLRASHVVAK